MDEQARQLQPQGSVGTPFRPMQPPQAHVPPGRVSNAAPTPNGLVPLPRPGDEILLTYVDENPYFGVLVEIQGLLPTTDIFLATLHSLTSQGPTPRNAFIAWRGEQWRVVSPKDAGLASPR